MLEQFLTPIIFAIFAIGFAIIWDRNKHINAAGIWALGYFFGFLSFALAPILNSFQELEFLRPFADTSYLVCALLLVVGCGSRYSQKIPALALGTVFTASLAVTYWHWFIVDDYSARAEALSYGCGALLGIGAWMLYPTRKTKRFPILFWIVAAFSVQIILIPVVTIRVLSETVTEATSGSSIFLELLTLSVALTTVCLAVTLLIDLGLETIVKFKNESETDHLTGLNNRRAFEALAEQAGIISAEQESPVSLIICDIDNFKRVNDKYGHASGDMVIIGFADILKSACRSGDHVGRIGGEEFGILMPGANLQMARLQAERLRVAFETYRGADLPEIDVFTASFGVAEFCHDEVYRDVFSRVDAALYTAKRDGRNRVRVSQKSLEKKPTQLPKGPLQNR